MFQLLGALVVGLVVVASWAAWRLSSGPIALDVLIPYVEEALKSPDGRVSARLDSVVLTLGGAERLLELKALGVRAYAGGDDPIATVPELSLSLNGRALLSGVVAPNSISMYGARIRLVRQADGHFAFAIGETGEADAVPGGSEPAVEQLRDALMGEPMDGRPGRFLRRVAVMNADLLVDDRTLGVSWHATNVNLIFRRVNDGIDADLRLDLDLAGSPAALAGSAHVSRADEAVSGEVRLRGLRPSALAVLGGPLAALESVDLPLTGLIRASGHLDGRIGRVDVELAGDAGRLVLPLAPPGIIPVSALRLKANLADGGRRAELTELYLDMGGPTAQISALADGLGGETAIKAEALLRDVPADRLAELWPQAVAANARDWVVANLHDGKVPQAQAAVSLRSASGRFDDVVIEHVGGEIQAEGVSVDYLRPMPPVRNARAVCVFDASVFRILVKGGELYGLRLIDGSIALSGLDQVDQFADIDLVVTGPAADALKVIDHQPLGYAKALGLEPAKIGGSATTRLKLKFPLLKDLRLDDLEVKAHASLKGTTLPKVLMGLDLNGGELELDVDAKGMDATGPVVLGTIPAHLKWRENFSVKGVPFRSRYQVKAKAVDDDQRRSLGLDGPPFVAPFVSGPVAADVTATFQGGGNGTVEARLDLATAAMELPGLGWKKPVGGTGTADVTVELRKWQLAAVPAFAVRAGDLATSGSVSFTPDGAARQVAFSALTYNEGRTSGRGTLDLRPGKGGLDVAFKGDSFDAAPVLASKDDRPAEGQPRRKSDLPPMTISGDVGMLWLSGKGGLKSATASLVRDAEEWRTIAVRGTVGEAKPVAVDVRQVDGARRRSVKVTSDDAGAFLKALDAYENMTGGKLTLDGHYDDTQDAQPIIGTARVESYHVTEAPALARLLTVAALTGIVDLLEGQGISFTTLDAPFTLADGLLTIKDGRAYGPALGLTGKGQVDLDHSRLALEGTVVPAYALNSVLGNIPVLGWLVTGGEKGGGLVAFNYTMSGTTTEPDVTVNPLSALTPGFLRNLFNIFDDGSETEARRRPTPKTAPPPAAAPAKP